VDAGHAHAGGPRVLRDEALDQLPAVAGREDEASEALHGVQLYDMPEDRHRADLDERLGNLLRALLQPRAAPAAQDRHRRALRPPPPGRQPPLDSPPTGPPPLAGPAT